MNSRTKSRKRLWIVLGVVIAVLVGGGVIAAKTLGGPTPLDPSQLATVETGDIARSVVATGKIWPITQVEVKSKASGIVARLDTDINATVGVPDAYGKDGHRVVPVKVGLSNGSKVEILSGLRSGDKVVLQQTS